MNELCDHNTALWPTFIRYNEHILRESSYAREFCDTRVGKGASKESVEKLVNHMHVWDVFLLHEDTPEEVYWEIGRLMVFSWEKALDSQMPDQNVEVELYDSGYGPAVTAFEITE